MQIVVLRCISVLVINVEVVVDLARVEHLGERTLTRLCRQWRQHLHVFLLLSSVVAGDLAENIGLLRLIHKRQIGNSRTALGYHLLLVCFMLFELLDMACSNTVLSHVQAARK